MTNHPFFVYGTLRPGQGNHARLLAGRTTAEVPATLPGNVLYGPALPYVTAGEEAPGVVGALVFVAQGSLVDTALRHLSALSPAEIAKLLRAHGHLTDEEYDYVMGPRPEKGRK